jgi:hypothetical protein
MDDPCGSGWVPDEWWESWEDDVGQHGCEEIPEGWKTIETNIDRIDGYVRMIVTEQATGRVLHAARYAPEVARTMAMILTMNAIKIEDENA